MPYISQYATIQRLSRVGLLLATMFIMACESKDSETVITENIYMSARVEVDKSSLARVRIELKRNSFLGTPLVLSGADRISLSFNGRNIPLTEDKDLIDVDYEGSIDTNGETGNFVLRFSRDNGVTLEAFATLAAPFNITTPTSGMQFTDDDLFVDLTWSNSRQNAEMNLDGTLVCTTINDDIELDTDSENESWLLDDTGAGQLNLAKLITNLIFEVTIEDEEIISARPCKLSFVLSRVDRSNLPGLDAASRFRVSQKRESSTYNVWGISSY